MGVHQLLLDELSGILHQVQLLLSQQRHSMVRVLVYILVVSQGSLQIPSTMSERMLPMLSELSTEMKLLLLPIHLLCLQLFLHRAQ